MDNYIPRILVPPKDHFFLLGPRGTGKSTWLLKTYQNATRVDLLQPEQERLYLAFPERLREVVEATPKEGVVILDEIQRVPSLLPIIHSLIEEKVSVQFIMTGSSARKLKREVGNLLGGRAMIRFMSPFFASELKEHFSMEIALTVGLIPMVYKAKTPKEKIQNYVGAYLREEVIAEGLVRQAGNFSRFLEVLSFSQGQILNVNAIARETLVKRATVDNYLEILEDLLIAFRLPVFTRRAKRALTHHPKFYYFDVGVYRSLRPKGALDPKPELEGPSFESLVAQHLRSWVISQKEVHQFCFWQTKSKVEVDFIIYGPRGFWAVEVKRGKSVTGHDLKALRIFCDEYPEASPLFLYSGKEKRKIHGVHCIPIKEFLLQLHPNLPIWNES